MSDFPAYLEAAPCPALQAAFRYSRTELGRLEAAFAAHASALSEVVTVAVGGSLGRLEAGAASDVDCIVVLRDRTPAALAAEQTAGVLALFASSPFSLPKADGIYRQAIERRHLVERTALGALDESPAVFGKRIQLLLDARPIFAAPAFEALQRDIVGWYASDFIVARPARGWTYLSNDLMRYLHSYAAWQQFKFARGSDDSWQLRQAKLRTSRLLTFAAMMYLLGESDRRGDKTTWLQARLDGAPLQRLFEVMQRHDAAAYRSLLEAYETTFALMSSPDARTTLIATGPDSESRMAAELHPLYERIHRASAEISRLLTTFALARQGDWGMRFFERWLF